MTLAELANHAGGFISTGPFGSQLHAHDYKPEGTPVVMPQQLGDNQISLEGIARISDEDRDRLSRHLMEEGDIVFSRRGDVTRRSYIGPSEAGWLCGTGCLLIRVKHPNCDNRFLSLFLSLPQFKEYITQRAVGATMPNLNQGTLGRVPVVLPSPTVQKRVVEILSAYDDLIEKNRRRMALLERAAQHLYEEWFVRLRFPGHEHTRTTSGIPDGWQRRPLVRCATFLSGGTPSKAQTKYWSGHVPWISSGEMTELRLHDSYRRFTQEGVEQASRLVPRNTILAVVRGMSLAKEFRIAISCKPVAFNQDLKALRCHPDVRPEYLFAALIAQRDQIRDRATEASHGTKKLDTAVLAAVSILLPTERLQRRFCDVVIPMNTLWDNCWEQEQKLRNAHNLLLPRLMSGTLAV
jgi:type I restriction enzyme S subunit